MSESQYNSFNRARRNWFGSYKDIMLMILSIIQGLAFQDLAQKAANIFPYAFHFLDWPILLHWVLCLIILIRIFQTYITVALDYEADFVTYIDAAQIMPVGVLQYCIFATLGNPSEDRIEKIATYQGQVFDVRLFYAYAFILTFFASMKYFANTKLIEPKRYSSRAELHREIRLQIINGIGTALIAIVSFCVWKYPHFIGELYAVPIGLGAFLTCQIIHSLRQTFGLRVFVKQEWSLDMYVDMSQIPQKVISGKVDRSNAVVRDASEENSADCEFIQYCITQRYIPELAELFGVSRSTVSDKLYSLINSTPGEVEVSGWRKRLISMIESRYGSCDNSPDAAKAETAKAETAKAETAKAEAAKAETAKAETAKAETAKNKDHGSIGLLGWRKWRIVSDPQGQCIGAIRYLNLVPKEEFIKELIDSSKIVRGRIHPTALEAKAEQIGYLQGFDTDRESVYALLLVDNLENAACVVDALLDTDYRTIYKVRGIQNVVFLIRGNAPLIAAIKGINDLDKSGVNIVQDLEFSSSKVPDNKILEEGSQSIIEQYIGLGSLHMLKITRPEWCPNQQIDSV